MNTPGGGGGRKVKIKPGPGNPFDNRKFKKKNSKPRLHPVAAPLLASDEGSLN